MSSENLTAHARRSIATSIAEGVLENVEFLDIIESHYKLSTEDVDAILKLIHNAGVRIND